MDPKKSNKIREIVRLQQILKKWKKLANAPKRSPNTNTNTTTTTTTNTCSTNNGSNKGINFLKRTLSFTDVGGAAAAAAASDAVPKGYLTVCVGKELKRFIIPTQYLAHQAFAILLREAEEEFGFQQEGVLQIPCEISVFEKILNKLQHNNQHFFSHTHTHNQSAENNEMVACCSPECHHPGPQMCR